MLCVGFWKLNLPQIYIQYISSPVGELILGEYAGQLCLADWRYRKNRVNIDKRLQQGLNAEYNERNSSLLQDVRAQLHAYFMQKQACFDIPLLLVGTAFQKQTWQALLDIPYGETCSYLGLATNITHAKAVRAVASAVGANAISIIIPCHRVIGLHGSLTGYAGGLHTKKALLGLEQSALEKDI